MAGRTDMAPDVVEHRATPAQLGVDLVELVRQRIPNGSRHIYRVCEVPLVGEVMARIDQVGKR
jgi:hypothetical protein